MIRLHRRKRRKVNDDIDLNRLERTLNNLPLEETSEQFTDNVMNALNPPSARKSHAPSGNRQAVRSGIMNGCIAAAVTYLFVRFGYVDNFVGTGKGSFAHLVENNVVDMSLAGSDLIASISEHVARWLM